MYYQEPLLFPRPFYMCIWYRTASDYTVDSVCYMFSLCVGVACPTSQLVLHVWNVMQSLYESVTHCCKCGMCWPVLTCTHMHARIHTHTACVHTRTHTFVLTIIEYTACVQFSQDVYFTIQVSKDFQYFIFVNPNFARRFHKPCGLPL